MEEHRFTARELTVAWKAGSLGWNAEKDTRRVITPWIEAAFGYGMVISTGIYFLASSSPWIFHPDNHSKTLEALVIGGVMYLGVCWMANRFMLWPRRVAMRVKHIGQGEFQDIQ